MIKRFVGSFILAVFLVGMCWCVTPNEPDLSTVKAMEVEPLESKYTLTYNVKEKTTYLGEFRLTAYCSCEKCCGKWALLRENELVKGAAGSILHPHHSLAVDPTIIPYGTIVYINGEEYVADDCGGSIKGNRIDVYFDSHEEALEFGVQFAEVFIKEEWE